MSARELPEYTAVELQVLESVALTRSRARNNPMAGALAKAGLFTSDDIGETLEKVMGVQIEYGLVDSAMRRMFLRSANKGYFRT